jgi:hypothetical protein
MDNQHRKISGYRELSQDEIDLMNKVKQKGAELEELLAEVTLYLEQQAFACHLDDHVYVDARRRTDLEVEQSRLERADPQRWHARAQQSFQEGVMFLVRAVAQPITF